VDAFAVGDDLALRGIDAPVKIAVDVPPFCLAERSSGVNFAST
jgi:hypothetical protein